MSLHLALIVLAGLLTCLSLRWPQLLVAAVLICLVLLMTGCEAMQPFVHVDKDGYQAGVQGTWPAVKRQVATIIGKPEPEGLAK